MFWAIRLLLSILLEFVGDIKLLLEAGMNFRLMLVLILVGLAVLFVIQNVVAVEIRFLFWSLGMSLSLLIFLLLAIGVIIGWFVHSYINHRKYK